MEQSISIKSKFDGRSHHGAFRQHLQHRWRRWLLVRTFVCIAVLGLGSYFAMHAYGRDDKQATFIATAFILLGSVGLMRPMIWQMWNERKLRKHPAYETEIRYTFSSEGVKMDGKAGKAEVPWSAFEEVAVTSKGLLIYQDKKEYLWIPSYDFADTQMGQVKQLFDTHQSRSSSRA